MQLMFLLKCSTDSSEQCEIFERSQNCSLNGGTTVLCEWMSVCLVTKAITEWIPLFWLYDAKLTGFIVFTRSPKS